MTTETHGRRREEVQVELKENLYSRNGVIAHRPTTIGVGNQDNRPGPGSLGATRLGSVVHWGTPNLLVQTLKTTRKTLSF